MRGLSRSEATEDLRFLAILTASSLFAVGAGFVLPGGAYRARRRRAPLATRRYSLRARRYARDRIAPEPVPRTEPEHRQSSEHEISAPRHREHDVARDSVISVAARDSRRSPAFLRPTLRRPTPRAVRRVAVPALVGALIVLVAVPIAWQLERTSDNVGVLPDALSEMEVSPQPETPGTVERTPEPTPLDSPSGETERPSPAVAATAPTIDRAHDAPTTASDPPRAPSAQVPAPRGRPTPATRPLTSVHSALLSDIVAPAQASPVRVQIPRIGLDARVEPVGVDPASRAVAVPPDGQTVAWYRHSAAPTQPGSAVLTAHVDYDGQRGAFFELRLLQPGDTITIELDDGVRQQFEVAARKSYARDELPRQRIFGSDGPPMLTLVTCGGGFNETERSYDSNVVVFALPVDAS